MDIDYAARDWLNEMNANLAGKWVNIESLKFARDDRRVTLPLADSKLGEQRWLLTIDGADGCDIHDSEKIRWYPFRSISLTEDSTALVVSSYIPLEVLVHVSSDVRVSLSTI